MKRKRYVNLRNAVIAAGCLLWGIHGYPADAEAAVTSWGDLEVRSTTKYQLHWSDDPEAGRLADETGDQDIVELLGVDMSLDDPDLTFTMFGKYSKDLDGTLDGSLFQDYLDTRTSRNHLSIFYAYLAKKDLVSGVDIRIGRQNVYGAESVNFDGIWFGADNLAGSNVGVEVFGGSIVQLYSQLDQDWVGGLNLRYRPRKSLSLYLDSVFYNENSFEGGFYWRPLTGVKANGYYSFINEHSRDAALHLTTDFKKTGTSFTAGVYRRFAIARDVPEDFILDYTSVYGVGSISDEIKSLYLSRLEGYIEYTLSVSQPVPSQHGMTVFGRYTNRQLSDEDKEDLYSTDFQRASAGLTLDEWLGLENFFFSGGWSYWWESRDYLYEAESSSFFLDLKQGFFDHFEASIGYYYKTEDVNGLIEGEASDHYYAGLKYDLDDDMWAKFEYSYEEDDYYQKEFGISSINALTLMFHKTF